MYWRTVTVKEEWSSSARVVQVFRERAFECCYQSRFTAATNIDESGSEITVSVDFLAIEGDMTRGNTICFFARWHGAVATGYISSG